MKKKAIEKIPYLTLPKVVQKKAVRYVTVTAFKNISKERHLFVEVYRNTKNTKAIPVVRIVLTKKDFGNYFPKKDEWTRQKIKTNYYYNSTKLLWHTQHEDRSRNYKEDTKKDILLTENDLDRIEKMCQKRAWERERWWENIYKHEDKIVTDARLEALNRKRERRQQALKERIENTPELPENRILDIADRIYLFEKHYLYYKKHGNYADITCSKCGGVTSGRWKDGISYEAQFQKWVDEPVEGRTGTCPMCGARGEYKCQGKVKGKHSQTIHLFLGQKYKENGLVMRYIEVSKTWILDLVCGKKGLEMSGALEELSGIEIARAYFSPEKKVQIDYHKYDPYQGKNFWDDCNLYGLKSIRIEEAPILSETWENMKGTIFQYSAIQEYAQAIFRFNPIDYLERYQETPQIEILVKMNLIGVVKSLVKYRYGIVFEQDANRPDKFLGIRKERVKQLIERKGDVDLLQTMVMENRMGVNWTTEQLEHITEAHLQRGQIEEAIRYMSIQQLLNRIEKYAGCSYGAGCSSSLERIRNTASFYCDYLHMRNALGYDLNNTIYQQPRDLNKAHAKMVLERSKKETDKRLSEVGERFANIKKQYRKLRNRYYYEDENYLIRPARTAQEIVMEGRILHHCVGGDNYLRKHDTGETYILMLRFKKIQDAPYITVEINAKDNQIMQWYGAHDKKPDEKNMRKWLDDYVKKLKNGMPAAGLPEKEQQVLLPAM